MSYRRCLSQRQVVNWLRLVLRPVSLLDFLVPLLVSLLLSRRREPLLGFWNMDPTLACKTRVENGHFWYEFGVNTVLFLRKILLWMKLKNFTQS